MTQELKLNNNEAAVSIFADIASFDSRPESFRQHFIQSRLEGLVANIEPMHISVFTEPSRGFIHPGSTVSANGYDTGFHLDDDSIYSSLLTVLSNMNQQPGWKERPFLQVSVTAVQYALDDYFGNTFLTQAQYEARNSLLWNDSVAETDEEPISRSIADYKGIGVCVERSAVACNMLAFLGVEAEFVFGELDTGAGKSISHAFLICQNIKGDSLLFDPDHPQLEAQDGAKHLKPFVVPGASELSATHPLVAIHTDTLQSGVVEKIYTYSVSPIYSANLSQS